jgi:Rad3-related DNA helicase
MIKLLLPHVDVVALSYAYLFDRKIREPFLKRLGGGEERSLSQYVVILDEAHNLPDTANEYESDSLASISVGMASQEADTYGKPDVERFADGMLKLIKGKGPGEHAVDFRALGRPR